MRTNKVSSPLRYSAVSCSILLPVVTLVTLLTLVTSAIAQTYTLDWFTIDGGGGTSSRGSYSFSGTIGQPDAGVLSGGNYAFVGGFWSGVVIETPGAPVLTITRAAATPGLTLSWDAPATGFVLEETSALTASILWAQVPLPYQTNAGKILVTEPSPIGMRFYRLREP